MEEEKKVEEIKEEMPVDDGKIHFPMMGLYIIGGIIILMIICVVLILVFKK